MRIERIWGVADAHTAHTAIFSGIVSSHFLNFWALKAWFLFFMMLLDGEGRLIVRGFFFSFKLLLRYSLKRERVISANKWIVFQEAKIIRPGVEGGQLRRSPNTRRDRDAFVLLRSPNCRNLPRRNKSSPCVCYLLSDRRGRRWNNWQSAAPYTSASHVPWLSKLFFKHFIFCVD